MNDWSLDGQDAELSAEIRGATTNIVADAFLRIAFICGALCLRVLARSGLAPMDEVEGLRLRQSSEDSVSLAPSLAEPINLEGQQDISLLSHVETF